MIRETIPTQEAEKTNIKKWLTKKQDKFGNTDQEEVTSDQEQCFMSPLTKKI